MDTAWEHRNRRWYGYGSWERASTQARVLHDWHIERNLGFDLETQIRHAAQHPKDARQWKNDRAILALILWRAARDHDVLVDEVLMEDTPRYHQRSDGADLLLGGPMPTSAHLADKAIDGWEDRLGAVLGKHQSADIAGDRSPLPLLCLGYCVRELRATPGWGRGDWATSVRIAHGYMSRAGELSRSGEWQVSREEIAAAAHAGLSGEPVYDYPPTPERPAHPTWLQRAHRLLSIGATLRTVQDAIPRTEGGKFTPLAMVLKGSAGACQELQLAAQEVERLWAAEPELPADLDFWDRQHVPNQLDQQTRETEHLIATLRTYLGVLTMTD